MALRRRRRRKNQRRPPIRARPARAPITIPAMAPPEMESGSVLVWVASESASFVLESEEEEEEEEDEDEGEDEPDDDEDEVELRPLRVCSQVESHLAAAVAAPTVVSESWGIAWTFASW